VYEGSCTTGKKNGGAELFEICARELRQPMVKPGVDTKVHPGYISASPCIEGELGRAFCSLTMSIYNIFKDLYALT